MRIAVIGAASSRARSCPVVPSETSTSPWWASSPRDGLEGTRHSTFIPNTGAEPEWWAGIQAINPFASGGTKTERSGCVISPSSSAANAPATTSMHSAIGSNSVISCSLRTRNDISPVSLCQARRIAAMRRGLEPADLGDLLDQPLVAVLATYRKDGEVLLSPVWHRWRDGGFDVATGSDDVKVRQLRIDGRASLIVYEPAPPYRGLELRTRATLVAEGAQETAREIAGRYLGVEAGEAYAAGQVDDVVIRLEPGALRAWDFADEYT